MGMTMEDKEKCAAIYEAFTGEYTEPSKWNEAAGNILAEMVDEIRKCTRGMGLARSVWPSSSKITWMWLVKIPYHIIKNEIAINRGEVMVVCLQVGVDAYKSSIFWELNQ